MKKIYFFILLTVIMSACHQKEENQDLKQEEMINEECLICKEHLIYLEKEEMMECAVCHQQFSSKTRCVNGHFVCDDCGNKFKGLDCELGATILTAPVRCPKCGSMHTMPGGGKFLFGKNNPYRIIYKKIWDSMDKSK